MVLYLWYKLFKLLIEIIITHFVYMPLMYDLENFKCLNEFLLQYKTLPVNSDITKDNLSDG